MAAAVPWPDLPTLVHIVPTRVGLLLYPGCMAAGLLASADLLQAANLRAGRARFDWRFVGVQPGPVDCAHGVVLTATDALQDASLDAVLVPGFWAVTDTQVAQAVHEQAELIRQLRGLRRGLRCWGYCTGVALVAESGRLDGQAATATWWMRPWLERRFPRVDWRWEHHAVATPRCATASGAHGHQAILAEEVERALGADAWRDIARFVVLPSRPPGLSVFEQLDAPSTDPLLGRLRVLVEGLRADEVRVATLAERLSTSPRTLARKVKASAGTSVAEHARLIKLRQAGERLAHSDQTVGQVCDRLGFSDETSFRRAFRRIARMTPGEFRKRYGR